MTGSSLDAPFPRASAAPLFASIVCGIDGSRADADVAYQAAILAGPSASLELVSVSWEVGYGLSSQATLTRGHADRALDRALHIARDAGMRTAETTRIDAPDPGAALLDAADGHDLLVLGSAGGGRVGGIALSRPVTVALHRAPSAVLVVRPVPGDEPFPARIVLADDGTPASDLPARTVAALAARHGSSVVVASPAHVAHDRRERLAEHATWLLEATGTEPVMADVRGPAHHALPKLAAALRPSLLVLGSRRLTGARALASVSERVAHHAPCSVLVTRGGES